MTDRQALLSAAGKQRPYKAVNIKPPAMPGDIYFLWGKAKKQEVAENLPEICMKWQENTGAWTKESILIKSLY